MGVWRYPIWTGSMNVFYAMSLQFADLPVVWKHAVFTSGMAGTLLSLLWGAEIRRQTKGSLDNFSLEIHEEATPEINKLHANDGIRAFYLKVVNKSAAMAENVRVSLSSDSSEIPNNYQLKTKSGNDSCEINTYGFELFPLLCVEKEGGEFYQGWLAPFTLTSCCENLDSHSDHYVQTSAEMTILITSKSGYKEVKLAIHIPKEDEDLADTSLTIL